ncbi:hypothetical protein FB45DRAFT_889424, partial [Roridomyces roridus]
MSMKTYCLFVQSADQLPWKLRPHFHVKVTGCSPELNTELLSSRKPQWNYESNICPTATQLTFQLHHKTKLICQGSFNIEDLLQKSQTAHIIELSLSKSGNKKPGRLWIRLTESQEHSDTNDTVALDQTPAAASSGVIPDKETWRQDIGKKVKQTWQGLHQITRIIAPFEYMENKEAVEDAFVKLSAQLVEVEGVLLDSEKYNIDITASSKELADLVIKQAVELRDIQSKATAKKIFEQHEITGKISQCIDILKQGTD